MAQQCSQFYGLRAIAQLPLTEYDACMIKAIIRTVLLVAAVLLLAPYVPFVAEHQQGLLIAAVALGLIGIIGRIFVLAIVVVAAVFFFHPFF